MASQTEVTVEVIALLTVDSTVPASKKSGVQQLLRMENFMLPLEEPIISGSKDEGLSTSIIILIVICAVIARIALAMLI